MFEFVLSYYRLFGHPTNSVPCPRLVMSEATWIDWKASSAAQRRSEDRKLRKPQSLLPPKPFRRAVRLLRTSKTSPCERQNWQLNFFNFSVTRSSHPLSRMLIRLCGRSQGASDFGRRSHHMSNQLLGWLGELWVSQECWNTQAQPLEFQSAGLSGLWLPHRIFLNNVEEKHRAPHIIINFITISWILPCVLVSRIPEWDRPRSFFSEVSMWIVRRNGTVILGSIRCVAMWAEAFPKLKMCRLLELNCWRSGRFAESAIISLTMFLLVSPPIFRLITFCRGWWASTSSSRSQSFATHRLEGNFLICRAYKSKHIF